MRPHIRPDAAWTFSEKISYEPDWDAGGAGYRAMEARTGGTYSLFRDDTDTPIRIEHIGMTDLAVHRESGESAVVGHMATGGYEDPRQYEQAEHLWIQRSGERRYLRVNTGGPPWSVDFSTDGSMLASLWWLVVGQRAVCGLIDMATGTARPLTVIYHSNGSEMVGGSEEVRFSPDDAWLLLTRAPEAHVVMLIEVATGSVLSVPCPGIVSAAWWPTRSPSSLAIACIDYSGNPAFAELDLSRGTFEHLGAIAFPDGVREAEDTRIHWGAIDVTPEPNGEGFLCLTAAASASDWSLVQPNRGFPIFRVAPGEFDSQSQGGTPGTVRAVPGAFLDGSVAARVEHFHPRWLAHTPSPGRVEIADNLRTGLRPARLATTTL
jgi:hypothetical protein